VREGVEHGAALLLGLRWLALQASLHACAPPAPAPLLTAGAGAVAAPLACQACPAQLPHSALPHGLKRSLLVRRQPCCSASMCCPAPRKPSGLPPMRP
jgi:hypothetical protein